MHKLSPFLFLTLPVLMMSRVASAEDASFASVYEGELRYPVGTTLIDKGCSLDLDSEKSLLWTDPTFTDAMPELVEFGDHDDTETSDTRCPGSPATLVDMKARVYYPLWTGRGAIRSFPLVVILHGQQQDWNLAGYEGYDYLGYQLARAGYVVASIDGRSLMDSTIKSRGEFIRAHLRHFVALNAAGSGSILEGRIDASMVSLIGHSRGGDAIAAAWEWQRVAPDPDYSIVALIAIAPVQFFGVLEEEPPFTTHLRDVAYQIIQGSKDGDVVDFQGLRQYDRAADPREPGDTLKSMVFIRNANHNSFNSMWDEYAGDDYCCGGTLDGDTTRSIAGSYILAFLEWHLYGESWAEELLSGDRSSPESGDPEEEPTEGAPEIALDYQAPWDETIVVDHFNLNTNTEGDPFVTSAAGAVEVAPERLEETLQELALNTNAASPWDSYSGSAGGAALEWEGALSYVSWIPAPVRYALDPAVHTHLSFRIAEVAHNPTLTEDMPHPLEWGQIILEDTLGRQSYPVDMLPRVTLTTFWQGIMGGPKTVMTQVRIPLSEFEEVELDSLASIRLELELGWWAELVLDDLRFTR